MACDPEILSVVPLFSLLDTDELAVFGLPGGDKDICSAPTDLQTGRRRRSGVCPGKGAVRVSTVDDDHQEVVVDEPRSGEFFGFASMLDETPHQTDAVAVEDSICLEIDRDDIATLLAKKPHAGMDLLTVLGRQFHAAQNLVRVRAAAIRMK